MSCAACWFEWASARAWPLHVSVVHEMDVPIDRRRPPFAECAGVDDPICGLARFSTHGCNGGGPSREQFVEAGGIELVAELHEEKLVELRRQLERKLDDQTRP